MQQLADTFWNFRGSFKIAKVLDIGTHMSLVRRESGRYILLDSYNIDEAGQRQLLALTNGGSAIDAIINVHPFHTLHCRAMYDLVPSARLIGTRRHLVEASDLPWETSTIETPQTQEEFSEDLDFSIPDGVHLVPDDESVHAGSVLVRHKKSGIVHVDDTINVLAAPGIAGRVLPQSALKFHPALPKALIKEPGAADAFASWAESIAETWSDTKIVCAAHSAVRRLPAGGWTAEILAALEDQHKVLARHRAEHG